MLGKNFCLIYNYFMLGLGTSIISIISLLLLGIVFITQLNENCCVVDNKYIFGCDHKSQIKKCARKIKGHQKSLM